MEAERKERESSLEILIDEAMVNLLLWFLSLSPLLFIVQFYELCEILPRLYSYGQMGNQPSNQL